MILHNIGRAHFLSEEGGGTGIIYIGYIIQRRDGYPGTRVPVSLPVRVLGSKNKVIGNVAM